MKKFLICIAVLILCAVAFSLGRCSRSASVIPASECEVIDSIITKDTDADCAPIVRDSVVVRYEYKTVPLTPPPDVACPDSLVALTTPQNNIVVVERGDSVEVSIPITQKAYETENYKAYVSGYNATLDSIFICRQTTTIRIREPTKQKIFSVGIQAGCGMTPKGFQPYIGVGITATLLSF